MLNRIRKAADEGFTLIELLIVIIILGVLAAIVVFAVGSTRKDSVDATCKTDVKSIQLAAEAVKTKTGKYPATQAAGADSIVSTAASTNGAVLKSWPGGTTSAAADDVFLVYTVTGSGTGYTLAVDGSNLPATTLTQDSDEAAVKTACTST